MTNEQIERIVTAALHSVAKAWAKGEDAMPVALLISGPKFEFVPGGWSTEREKDQFAEFIRRLCKRPDVEHVVFTTEAWARFYAPGEDMKILPRDREDRREIFCIQIESRDGFTHSRSYEIKRDANRKWVERDKFDLPPEGSTALGRFVGWF
jgi:hypothetical protein